jgi:hypothetical protein
MTRARDIANNWAADITGVTAGTGITGGGTSGAVTVTNSMATTIDAKGDLVVGSGADAFVRVAVGSNNQVLTADSATTSGVKWATADALPSQTGNSGKYLTTDGTTASWGSVGTKWTYRATASDSIYSIAYNGSNLYVAVGSNGSLLSSPDAITWTSRTSGFGAQDIRRVAYGNGLWVAVGNAGTITTSTDGITWTARTSNMSGNDINDVVYANSVWVAVGQGGGTTNTGGIIYSTDGITWTRKSQSLTIGATYFTVVYNGTNWIVGADVSTNNYLYASTPSGTWTAAVAGSAVAMRKIFWDGTRHIFYTNAWKYSTSTTLGGQVEYIGLGSLSTNVMWQSAYYNNVVYFGEVYWTSFTPASTSNISVNTLQISPTATTSSSTPLISDGIVAFFAGAAGLIVAGGRKIYTSF